MSSLAAAENGSNGDASEVPAEVEDEAACPVGGGATPPSDLAASTLELEFDVLGLGSPGGTVWS